LFPLLFLDTEVTSQHCCLFFRRLTYVAGLAGQRTTGCSTELSGVERHCWQLRKMQQVVIKPLS